MLGKDAWVAGLTVGKPQGRSLWVGADSRSGSAASHPDSGSCPMVEFSEESPFFRSARVSRQRAAGRGLGEPVIAERKTCREPLWSRREVKIRHRGIPGTKKTASHSLSVLKAAT